MKMIRISETGNPSNYIEIPALERIRLQAAVSFYRSQQHLAGNYGVKDTDYTGTFGFDRFDKKIMGEGLAEDYARVAEIKTAEKVAGNSYQHLCAYISLYPPNTEGNKTTATVYAKLQPSKNFGNQDKEPTYSLIGFVSSDPTAISIVGSDEDELQRAYLTMEDETKEHHGLNYSPFAKITLECLKPFEEAVTITAINVDKEIIGTLICYPNAARYTTVIQPVEISFGTIESQSVTKVPNTSFSHELLKSFNTTSFNQAFINATLAPTTHKIVLKNSQFAPFFMQTPTGKKGLKSENHATQYNTLIESRYAALLVDQGALNKLEEKLKEKGQAMLEAFDRRYRFKSNRSLAYVKELKEEKYVTNILEHRNVKPAFEEYKKARAAYDELKGENSDVSLNKTHTIHVFITRDVDQAYNNAAAYSKVGSGVVHLFKSLLEHRTAISGTLHEIGHSLGLKHTFSNELEKTVIREKGVVYKSDLEKEIEINKKDLENLLEQLKNVKTDNFEYQIKTLNSKYTLLNKNLIKKENFLININYLETFFMRDMESIVNIENGLENIKRLAYKTSLDIKNEMYSLEKKLQIAEKQIEAAQNSRLYNRKKKQSYTLENYMDYHLKSNGEENSKVERKIFYHWQWEQMRELGNNVKYLKEINKQ